MAAVARLVPAVLALLASAAAWAGATFDPADARRLLTLLAGVRDEYHEAFDDAGALVRPIELDEARLLVAEARDHVDRLGAALPAGTSRELDDVVAGLDAHVAPASLAARVARLRTAVSEATGVAEDVSPPAPPSRAAGRAVFLENCAPCHGADGGGHGTEAQRLELAPANFRDVAFMRGETPRDFFNVVTLGRRRSGMPAWGEALTVQQRWDVVSHVWSLATPAPAMAEGQGVWLAHCAGCHGAAGDGKGPQAVGLLTPVPDLTAALALVDRTDADLFAAVTQGVPGTAMPGFGTTLGEAERWKTVAYLRALSLGGSGDRAAATSRATVAPADVSAAFADIRRAVGAATTAYRAGDAGASGLATDAYMRFEPFEARLGAVHPAQVRALEEQFLALRTAIRRGASPDDVDGSARAIVAALADAEATLAVPPAGWPLFLQSAAIILREGFEIVLVVGALATYVRRSGQTALVSAVRVGTVLGVVASLGTAAVLATLLRLRPGASDVLEGVAMLVAAGVLFWVSWWIVSRAEAERWQRYIQGKARAALATGSRTALASAAFLAVYREGFETVLFYQALLGGLPAANATVAAGFVTGLALLAVVYAAFTRFEGRLPMRQFFLVTGGFLYAMAIVFAGRGVHELQEAQVLGVTPVAWMPRLDALGVFPTVESLAAQAVLVACLVYATVVTLRARKRRPLPPVGRLDEAARRRAAGRTGPGRGSR
jgi:cbb3-type cytochrome c oxidase subunit III